MMLLASSAACQLAMTFFSATVDLVSCTRLPKAPAGRRDFG